LRWKNEQGEIDLFGRGGGQDMRRDQSETARLTGLIKAGAVQVELPGLDWVVRFQ